MLVFTITILIIAKFWKKQLIQIIILGAIGYTSFYVLYPLYGLVFPMLLSLIFSIICAVVLVLVLIKYPEWYVIDICGIIVGAGAILFLVFH